MILVNVEFISHDRRHRSTDSESFSTTCREGYSSHPNANVTKSIPENLVKSEMTIVIMVGIGIN